jgi:hypothetical protein
MGAPLRNWPYPRLRPGELSVSWLNANSTPEWPTHFYEVALDFDEPNGRMWVVTLHERVTCVIVRRNQTYHAAVDSLTSMFQGTKPVWSDSSGIEIQTAWYDGHLIWGVAGSWVEGAGPILIHAKTVEPAGTDLMTAMTKSC